MKRKYSFGKYSRAKRAKPSYWDDIDDETALAVIRKLENRFKMKGLKDALPSVPFQPTKTRKAPRSLYPAASYDADKAYQKQAIAIQKQVSEAARNGPKPLYGYMLAGEDLSHLSLASRKLLMSISNKGWPARSWPESMSNVRKMVEELLPQGRSIVNEEYLFLWYIEHPYMRVDQREKFMDIVRDVSRKRGNAGRSSWWQPITSGH